MCVVVPIPTRDAARPPRHLIAPISTILFVPKSQTLYSASNSRHIPSESNIPADKHWTDIPPPGSIALLQQPTGQVCAVCGDILATRLKVRGVKGVVADGRVRDIVAMNDLSRDGDFSVWSRGTSTVGTGMEAKAWCADIPLRIGDLEVNTGDILCADEGERGCVVIPRRKLEELVNMLPGLKEADDKCVADVQAGVDVNETFRRHRGWNPAS